MPQDLIKRMAILECRNKFWPPQKRSVFLSKILLDDVLTLPLMAIISSLRRQCQQQ